MHDKAEQHYGLFQGDSGGPLNCFNPETNHWELCGIVSFGYRCGTGNGSIKCVIYWPYKYLEQYNWLMRHYLLF